MTEVDQYAELEAALIPLRAAHPGITNQEVAPLLPERLRQQLWKRAVGSYLEAELAKLDAAPKRPTQVTTVATVLDGNPLPGVTSLEAAVEQPHAMVNEDGDVFYPDSAEDAAWFAREHAARPLNPNAFPFQGAE